MQLSFGPREGAALVAVERANGGELAPLGQVLWALHSFTPPHSRPSAAEFAASATLLIELGAVEYVEYQLGLTPEGRKLLRRSGMPNNPRHVAIVTELLQEFDDEDFEPDGVPVAPTAEDVHRALNDEDSIEQTGGGAVTPVIEERYSPILGAGTPDLVMRSHRVPAVPPRDSDELPQAPDPVRFGGSPAHPVLDRLFGRGRRDRNGPAGARGS
jgi:hypothetical protein